MPKYMHYDYNQDSMVVINFEEQIQPETFEVSGIQRNPDAYQLDESAN